MKKISVLVLVLVVFGLVITNGKQAKEAGEKTGSAEHKEHDTKVEADHEKDHMHSDDEVADHGHEGDHHKEDEDEHGHGDEHGEENPQVGPDKGIVNASEGEGIQLSPEAEKNFEIQWIKINGSQPIEIPKGAIVTAGVEVNLYRYRSGFYKRIDFELLSKSESHILIRSKELKSGDEVVIAGMGFIRIAEIAAFGGAPEGHSH